MRNQKKLSIDIEKAVSELSDIREEYYKQIEDVSIKYEISENHIRNIVQEPHKEPKKVLNFIDENVYFFHNLDLSCLKGKDCDFHFTFYDPDFSSKAYNLIDSLSFFIHQAFKFCSINEMSVKHEKSITKSVSLKIKTY